MDRTTLETWLSEGLSLDEIGRRTGRHPSTVSYWLRKHGLTPANQERHAPRGGIPREALEALVAAELTTREIAQRLGMSQANVRYWLRRHELRVIRARGVRQSDAEQASGTLVRGDCPRHGPEMFVRRPDGAWRCTRCRVAAVTERRRRVKALLVEEAGGACALCGFSRTLAALQFHHVDPQTKRFAVAGAGVARSLEAARAEAAKCVLLCATCHAEVEAGAVTLPR
ncbi:MAG TPA: helix-turn-helix domain-containing protein [Solirubrobacteraceae bacterium]|jgi:DNA-binding transcriptional ArsR family regulator